MQGPEEGMHVPGCKVHSRHHYTRDFYCEAGTEDEQAEGH